MSQHNLQTELQGGPMPASFKGLNVIGTGYNLGWGTTTPTDQGWAPGALFIVNGATSAFYQNTGTALTAVWTPISSETGMQNLVILTGYTAAITDADALTVGGIKVPQNIIIPFTCMPHATNLTRTLFYSQTDAWTVTGVGVVMDLVDDTAITASICKVTGNNVAVAATTPLHTGTFNMQTTAGTPQVGTLTSTGADLALAATNKIGIVFSGALDVGICSGWIKMKRV